MSSTLHRGAGKKKAPPKRGFPSDAFATLEVIGRVGGEHVADEIVVREAAAAAARVDEEQTIAHAGRQLRNHRDGKIGTEDAVRREVGLVRSARSRGPQRTGELLTNHIETVSRSRRRTQLGSSVIPEKAQSRR